MAGQQWMTKAQPQQVAARDVPEPMAMAPRQADYGIATNNAAVAVAERARAMVQARALVALHRPRDVDDVRIRLLRECGRPGFAKGARYAKPVGGSKVTGPSIRFAEAAIRVWGNCDVQAETTYEDDDRRIIRVSVVDLETNASYSVEVVVAKEVERSTVKDGQEVLGQRVNSRGVVTFLVRASEDEMATKQAAAVSKAIRTSGLRLIPGDIVDECMTACDATLRNGADRSESDRRQMLGEFARVGVRPPQLAAYLGHSVETVNPAEMADLFPIFEAIRDGHTTWAAVMEQRKGESGEHEPAQSHEHDEDAAWMSEGEGA